jgi:hypothetical protein
MDARESRACDEDGVAYHEPLVFALAQCVEKEPHMLVEIVRYVAWPRQQVGLFAFVCRTILGMRTPISIANSSKASRLRTLSLSLLSPLTRTALAGGSHHPRDRQAA